MNQQPLVMCIYKNDYRGFPTLLSVVGPLYTDNWHEQLATLRASHPKCHVKVMHLRASVETDDLEQRRRIHTKKEVS